MSTATQRLYLDAGGNIVLHGDPSAETLLCAVGQEITPGFSELQPEAEPKQKAVPAPANKAVKAPANK